jgi:hypothetical protein
LKRTAKDGKTFHACGLVESTLWKKPYYQSNVHVQCNHYKNFNTLQRNRKFNHEIHMEIQKTSNSHSISEKKSNAGGITIPGFILYYRPITIKTAWYWAQKLKDIPMITIDDPDINPPIYSKGAQNT